MERLHSAQKVVGLKQSQKAVLSGKAKLVYIAEDADPWVTDPLQRLCKEQGVEVLYLADLVSQTTADPEIRKELVEKHRLFIVSNSQSGYPQLCIDKLGLGDYIQGHLCFGDTGTNKGQTILKLMRDYDITSAIYVGDTQGDLEATREAGIPFLFAGFGLGQPESWDLKIDRFEDLLELSL